MKKRLMILGGSRYVLPVIKAAHELDCYVITADYLPDNIAHKYSDEYVEISIIEKDTVLKAAQERNIDGIMSFACDPGVVSAAYVAEKMVLPFAGSYESVSTLQNKSKFRKFLSGNGFNVPFAKGYKRVEEAIDQIGQYSYPIIIKPTDSAGSKGVTKVLSRNEVKNAIFYALDNSIDREFIIEEFIECKGNPSDSECFSVNGELKFVSWSSQRFDPGCGNPYAPTGFTWNPTISDGQQDKLSSELQRLLHLLNMGTSIYNVEAREAVDGKMYIMEVSPRGGGNRLAEMLRFVTGVDLIELAVKAALGEQIIGMPDYKVDGLWAEIILHSRKDGKFNKISISNELKNYIIEKDVWVKTGDIVENFSGANKAIGTLVLRFDDKKTMEQVMANPFEYISVDVV